MSGRLFAVFCVVVAAAFVALILWFVKLPPDKIRLATGSAGSAYDAANEQLKTILARSGVTVELVQTRGTAQKIARLNATGKDAVDGAIFQSGIPDAVAAPGIANLGAIFIQPIWLFGRNLPPGIDVRRLVGKRVAIGKEGSNNRIMAEMLLAENNLTPKDMTLVPLGGDEAANALLAHKIDAVWLMGGAKAHWVQTLLASPELELVSFDRAAAYARKHSFLVDVVLAQGVIDLGRNMPGHDLKLVGPTAQLIVRKDLHPALQSLLLDAMQEAFSPGDQVTPPGMYPNKDLIDIPLSDEARRYYTSGPSFFRRVLPYWAANFAERAVIFLIPLFTLFLPLAQAAPPFFKWRIRRRINVWYRQLRLLETRGLGARSSAEREEVREKLQAMVREVTQLRVPLDYADDVYRLRAHIRFVLDFVTHQLHAAAP